DISRAKEILGWEPKVERAEGLKKVYEYFSSLSPDELKRKEHRNFSANS
ncbi:MAG: SDR family NAD-dependent epimerase/dehydratase, partial [Eudoraea sp.]|nr:SDR family NAD-dependent epimerase/dehydratase [Eudoraea sp.]